MVISGVLLLWLMLIMVDVVDCCTELHATTAGVVGIGNLVLGVVWLDSSAPSSVKLTSMTL